MTGASTESSLRILVIDDDEGLCAVLKGYLAPLGYEVDVAADGKSGLQLALSIDYAAVILDVRLPLLNGIEVLRRLRESSSVPVIMMSSLGDEPDRVAGLEIGADDYLPKGSSPRELLARLRAVVRRASLTRAAEPERPKSISIGSLFVDSSARRASLNGVVLDLTHSEFELLRCLASSPDRVRSREELLESLSDRSFNSFDRSIDVHIAALRRKLGDDARKPRFVETVRGSGYRMKRPRAPG